MVVGSDIAELLLSTVQQEEAKKVVEVEDIRDDTEGADGDELENEVPSAVDPPVVEPRDEEKLVQQFCSHLLYGHKKDALGT